MAAFPDERKVRLKNAGMWLDFVRRRREYRKAEGDTRPYSRYNEKAWADIIESLLSWEKANKKQLEAKVEADTNAPNIAAQEVDFIEKYRALPPGSDENAALLFVLQNYLDTDIAVEDYPDRLTFNMHKAAKASGYGFLDEYFKRGVRLRAAEDGLGIDGAGAAIDNIRKVKEMARSASLRVRAERPEIESGVPGRPVEGGGQEPGVPTGPVEDVPG